MMFLGLGLEDRTPDATTIWPYRERLAKAGVVEALFDKFDDFPRARGYRAMGGRIVDARWAKKGGDRTKAKVRARVEQVFGAQANDMGGTLARGIGIMRARAQIGLRENPAIPGGIPRRFLTGFSRHSRWRGGGTALPLAFGL